MGVPIGDSLLPARRLAERAPPRDDGFHRR
jgi:hypothetical protein